MAGRPSKTRRLDVWMNGQLVGQWSTMATGVQQFAYDATWHDSHAARPLSLSLPLSLGTKSVSGHAVAGYFDNLLPDSTAIRTRIASRQGAASNGAFDLLEKIGRDCIGAVQLLPAGSPAPNVRQITSRPLTEAEVEVHLEAVVAGVDLGVPAEDELRISLAGAQEKTALLYDKGGWHLPQGATPTTHIFKLPMGDVGLVRADFSTSVENEWLCAKIMQAYGQPGPIATSASLAGTRCWWSSVSTAGGCMRAGLPGFHRRISARSLDVVLRRSTRKRAGRAWMTSWTSCAVA